MTSLTSSLPRLLRLDAVVTGAFGATLVVLAPWLSRWLAIPADLLAAAGWILLPFAALLAWAAGRETPPRRLVWFIVLGNGLWALESLALLFTPWLQPNPLGLGLVAGQAVAVAGLAAAQAVAARRSNVLRVG